MGLGTVREEKVTGSIRPALPGITNLRSSEGTPRLYAVNVSPDESRLAPWPSPEDFARPRIRRTSFASDHGRIPPD